MESNKELEFILLAKIKKSFESKKLLRGYYEFKIMKSIMKKGLYGAMLLFLVLIVILIIAAMGMSVQNPIIELISLLLLFLIDIVGLIYVLKSASRLRKFFKVRKKEWEETMMKK